MEAHRLSLPRARVPALGAGLLCALFIAVMAWWLAVDQRVPDFDSGKHLLHSFAFAAGIENGQTGTPFNLFTDYPPLAHTVAAIGVLIGGQNATAPILTLALVFTPLLVFSVYRSAVLLADARVGLLAARYLTFWGTLAWYSSEPVADDPVPGIMRAARRDGVRRMEFDVAVDRYDFNPTGLTALAVAEELVRPPAYDPAQLGPDDAFITVRPVPPGGPRPCGTLESDGAGVYLIRGPVRPGRPFDYCPTRERAAAR